MNSFYSKWNTLQKKDVLEDGGFTLPRSSLNLGKMANSNFWKCHSLASVKIKNIFESAQYNNMKNRMAMLEICWNESWRKRSNQIWPMDKKMCVRALYCFGDEQICPRKQWLGASELPPYLHAKITEFRQWWTRFPPAWQCLGFVPAQQYEGEKTCGSRVTVWNVITR